MDSEPLRLTWLLLVDHDFHALAEPFCVETPKNIHLLKKKVKEEKPEALSRVRVDPDELTVWKTKGAKIIDESTIERLEDILSGIDDRDQDTIEVLKSHKRVADLAISEGQTLLVRLPGALRVPTLVGCVLIETIAVTSNEDHQPEIVGGEEHGAYQSLSFRVPC